MFDEQPDGDPRRTRDVAGIRRFLTPQQMAEEIVRLDAVIAGQAPNIVVGRLPPTVAAPAEGQPVERFNEGSRAGWELDGGDPAEGQRYWCNKCGYRGPDRFHQRPNGSECSYIGRLVPAEGRPGTAGVKEVAPVKHWCETCEGLGTIDETLGGESFSNPKATCPDCDGQGWWTPRAASGVTPTGEAQGEKR